MELLSLMSSIVSPVFINTFTYKHSLANT